VSIDLLDKTDSMTVVLRRKRIEIPIEPSDQELRKVELFEERYETHDRLLSKKKLYDRKEDFDGKDQSLNESV